MLAGAPIFGIRTSSLEKRGGVLVPLFAITLFVSATLLFLVEPMFAKMVLPLLGGTPAVWNTCMVFFQAALLAGYAYAHLATSFLRPSRQIPVHLALVSLALFCLPITIAGGWSPPRDANPTLWLLLLLTVSVGLPFFVISTSAPVLQNWISRTTSPAARDPYFLYAASNSGSIVGLLGYLIVLEPHFTLTMQSHIWTWGYTLLLTLTGACAAAATASARRARYSREESISSEEDTGEGRIPWSRRVRWVALAFVPSSLMLGVTTYLTTDIASVPLLWVVPLVLYLLTFILAFAGRRVLPLRWFLRTMPMLVLLQLLLLLHNAPLPLWVSVLHLLTFFVVAMACHSELADDRPSTSHLTEFYLLLSIGGVLGGIFNALVSPVLFNSIVEYPLILILACALCLRPRSRLVPADIAWPLILGAVAAVVLVSAHTYFGGAEWLRWALLAVLAVACYAMAERPIRFALGLGALAVAAGLISSGQETLLQERTFFGVLRVKADPVRHMHSLIHGTTLHGRQCMIPTRRRDVLTYYGPAANVIRSLQSSRGAREIAVIGLGAATLASCAERGLHYTFYEIDPAVERIASNPAYFTFITDARARGAQLKILLGDARLVIADAKPKAYDVIVVDAFSSDSIPVHLLTREALRLYMSKLSGRGILLLHISNRSLDLKPVVVGLADDAHLRCRILDQNKLSRGQAERGRASSTWAALARDATDLDPVLTDPGWKPVKAPVGAPVWTDDFSNILQVIRWRR